MFLLLIFIRYSGHIRSLEVSSLYRNGLQGLGYGLVPMLGGVFELAARSAIVMFVAGKTSFAGVCLADPAAWIAALIPLIPYYIYVMKSGAGEKRKLLPEWV